ncbi:MAG: substrate-binding domain-containing protein [Phycisphaerae bacterium]
MIDMKRIMFLGNLAAAYNRYVLKGVVAYTIAHPHLRVFFLDSLNIADIRGLLKSGFHGVIVGSCPLESHLPRWVVESGVPAVDASGQHIFENVLPRVLTDDPATGRLAVDYFFNRGFRHLVFYGLKKYHWADLRWQGFESRARELGLTVKRFDKQGMDTEDREGKTPDTAARWLRDLEKPTAIFAGNDFLAAYLIEACVEMGLRVPEDVAVLGADDDDLYVHIREPEISSIPLRTNEIGFNAMAMLQSLIQKQPLPSNSILLVPDRVITRRSTDLLAVQDSIVREALVIIKQQLKNGIGPKGLAHRLEISKPTLQRHFFAALGRGPSEEIHRTQMELVQRLLADSRMPMAQITTEAGFSSPRRFSEWFHREVGTTPTQYRQRHARDWGSAS